MVVQLMLGDLRDFTVPPMLRKAMMNGHCCKCLTQSLIYHGFAWVTLTRFYSLRKRDEGGFDLTLKCRLLGTHWMFVALLI